MSDEKKQDPQPVPVGDADVLATVFAGIKALQDEVKMRREKAEAVEVRLSESIRKLEQFAEDVRKAAAAGGKSIFTASRLPSGVLEVSAAGRDFRIDPQGRFV